MTIGLSGPVRLIVELIESLDGFTVQAWRPSDKGPYPRHVRERRSRLRNVLVSSHGGNRNIHRARGERCNPGPIPSNQVVNLGWRVAQLLADLLCQFRRTRSILI